MTLVKRPFGETFTFSRPVAADYRAADGTIQTAGVNIARLDHDEDGNLLGLLVAPGAGFGEHDAIATVAGWDGGIKEATVLHCYAVDGTEGRVERCVAFYTRSAKATADACLRTACHHRSLRVVDGFLRNRGGYVRYDHTNWALGSALQVSPGPVASPVLADDDGRIVIEG